MADLIKFNQFKLDIGLKVHNFLNDTFKWYLTNAIPSVSSHAVKANLAEIATGNGYTGPITATVISFSLVNGTAVWSLAPPSAISATGTVGPFRYLVLYNDTPSSPLDPLIGYTPAATSITLQNTDTYSLNITSDMTIAA